jgi:hypothetical protein
MVEEESAEVAEMRRLAARKAADHANVLLNQVESYAGRLSTNKAYNPWKKEFSEWAKREYDNDLVTDQMLNSFLTEVLLKRNIKKRKTLGTEEEENRLSYNSVKQCVSAIVDLWSMQANLGQNRHQNPRTKLIKDKLLAIQKKETERTHDSLADRGVGTGESIPNVKNKLIFCRFLNTKRCLIIIGT